MACWPAFWEHSPQMDVSLDVNQERHAPFFTPREAPHRRAYAFIERVITVLHV